MRKASVVFVVVFAAGLVLLLAVGVLEQRSEAFTLGVVPTEPLDLAPNAEVCQNSIDVPTAFSRVRIEVESGQRSPPLFEVRVLSGNRELGEGSSSGALGGRREVVVTVGEVSVLGPISVCVRNTGEHPLQVYGNSGAANPASASSLDREHIDYDMDVRFLRATDVSLITLAGDIVARASLFRGEWIGPWSVWLTLALLLTAFPLLLYRALRDVDR